MNSRYGWRLRGSVRQFPFWSQVFTRIFASIRPSSAHSCKPLPHSSANRVSSDLELVCQLRSIVAEVLLDKGLIERVVVRPFLDRDDPPSCVRRLPDVTSQQIFPEALPVFTRGEETFIQLES